MLLSELLVSLCQVLLLLFPEAERRTGSTAGQVLVHSLEEPLHQRRSFVGLWYLKVNGERSDPTRCALSTLQAAYLTPIGIRGAPFSRI